MASGDREAGFIVVRRQVRSSSLYRSLTGEQRSVFYTVLLLANWGCRAIYHSGSWYQVGRGELAHSLATIAEEAGVSVKVVRTTIAKMMADDTLIGGRGPFLKERWTGTQPGTGLRLLTVCRYEEYQDIGHDAGTQPGTAGARQGHDAGTAGAPREPEEPEEPTTKSLSATVADPPSLEVALTELWPNGTKPPPPVKGPDLPAPAADKPKREKAAPDPKHHPLKERLMASYLELRGVAYGFGGAKDAAAVTSLLRLSAGDVGEVDRRWRRALELGEKWPGCGTIALLPGRWNELAAATGPPRNWAKGRVGSEEIKHSDVTGIVKWGSGRTHGQGRQAGPETPVALVSGQVGQGAAAGAGGAALGGPEGADGAGARSAAGAAP